MNKMRLVFIASLLSLIPSISLAYSQQYVGGNAQDQPQAHVMNQTTQTQNKQLAPTSDIYVAPREQEQNNQTNSNANQPEESNEPRQENPTPSIPQTPEQNLAQTVQNPRRQDPAPSNQPVTTNQVPTMPSNQPIENNALPIASGGYTVQEKQAWFKSCLRAIHDSRVAPYANEFCTCGWTLISSGQLPPRLLVSNTPQDMQKRGQILSGISQVCMVEVLSRHKLR